MNLTGLKRKDLKDFSFLIINKGTRKTEEMPMKEFIELISQKLKKEVK